MIGWNEFFKCWTLSTGSSHSGSHWVASLKHFGDLTLFFFKIKLRCKNKVYTFIFYWSDQTAFHFGLPGDTPDIASSPCLMPCAVLQTDLVVAYTEIMLAGGTKATAERVIYLLFTGPGVPYRVAMRDWAVGLRHLALSTGLLAILLLGVDGEWILWL